MTMPLWTYAQLRDALFFAEFDGPQDAAVTGVSIDTRTLQQGDLFVALKDQRDGHEFVTNAFKAGAAAALVGDHYARQPGDGLLIKCTKDYLHKLGTPDARDCDPLFALEVLGSLARLRLAPDARVIAVTGSAGKTGTKEMLRACLSKLGKTHASEKSYNNHWGVPLTLARMPADTNFGVFEIGMNHAGEIAPLTRLVKPHAAIVTTVEAVHLEHFPSVEAIADAKAEIFQGLAAGGAAIVKRDNPHFARLKAHAHAHAAKVIEFGIGPGAGVFAHNVALGEDGTSMVVSTGAHRFDVRLAIPGRHIAENAVAVIAALEAVGADTAAAVAALETLAPPGGRGARTIREVDGGEALIIDESYNANPASMRAALLTLSTVPRAKFPRRIVVLGDMLELGPASAEMHRNLKDAVEAAGTDVIFACGPHMKGLYDCVAHAIKGHYSETASGLKEALLAELRAGDAVMIKGSNGMRLQPLVAALQGH